RSFISPELRARGREQRDITWREEPPFARAPPHYDITDKPRAGFSNDPGLLVANIIHPRLRDYVDLDLGDARKPVFGIPARRFQLDISGFLRFEGRPKAMVDVSQDRRTRPKIRSHAKDVARKLALDRITRLPVCGDVGATKAIDRLLW